MIGYLDSSVLLRLVLAQPGRLEADLDVDAMVSSTLTELETRRTIDRLYAMGRLSTEALTGRLHAAESMLGATSLIEIDRDVLRRAAAATSVPLGTLDAIHLASAALWRERTAQELIFFTHDSLLATAARLHGFEVIGA